MNDKNTILLNKIYINSKTATEALDIIMEKDNSFELKKILYTQYFKYLDIANDANMILRELEESPEKMNFLDRLEVMAELKLIGLKKHEKSYLAEVIINGCLGGINEMIKEIKKSREFQSDCLDLAHILIETEQETIAMLQRFL